jgi:hypothetical protein
MSEELNQPDKMAEAEASKKLNQDVSKMLINGEKDKLCDCSNLRSAIRTCKVFRYVGTDSDKADVLQQMYLKILDVWSYLRGKSERQPGFIVRTVMVVCNNAGIDWLRKNRRFSRLIEQITEAAQLGSKDQDYGVEFGEHDTPNDKSDAVEASSIDPSTLEKIDRLEVKNRVVLKLESAAHNYLVELTEEEEGWSPSKESYKYAGGVLTNLIEHMTKNDKPPSGAWWGGQWGVSADTYYHWKQRAGLALRNLRPRQVFDDKTSRGR